MARPIWTGTLSFGLLNVPVSLMSGERRTDLHFRMLDSRDRKPVRYERVNADTGEEVPWKEIVKAYEYDKGSYVVLEEADIKAAAPESHETVEVETFIDAADIDPRYYEKPYVLVPAKKAEKGYVLLRETLRGSNRVGIARVVIRTREYLAAVLPQGDALVLMLLRYPQELVDPADYPLPAGKPSDYRLTAKELQMAEQLIDSMSGKWVPDDYKDEFRERLQAIIRKRIKGKGNTTPGRGRGRAVRRDRDQRGRLHVAVEAEPGCQEAYAGEEGRGASPTGEGRCQAGQGAGQEGVGQDCRQGDEENRRQQGDRTQDRVTGDVAARLQPQARLRRHPGAQRWRARAWHVTTADLRRAVAPRLQPPLRLPPGSRRRAQELGGAEGPVAARGRKAPGGAGRGPSAGLRRLQGDIPAGHYGAGHVDLFDRGTWAIEGDPLEAIARQARLRTARRQAQWRLKLVRTGKQAKQPQWLLIKRSDAHADDREADDLVDTPAPASAATAPGSTARKARSTPATASRRSAATATTTKKSAPRKAAPRRKDATWRKRALAIDRARGTPHPSGFAPELCTLRSIAPAGDGWLHEIKWDGYRLLADLVDGVVKLRSRNDLDWTGRVPEVAHAVAALPVSDARLDGELVVLDAQGRSDFSALQRVLEGSSRQPLRYVLFDMPGLAGVDLSQAPLLERKRLLQELLGDKAGVLAYSDHVVGHGAEVLEASGKAGFEGIVSKRVDARYAGGRGKDWIKTKHEQGDEFVVVGYTAPKGARGHFGSLLLAQPEAGGLRYVGRVGSGFGEERLRTLYRRMRPLETDRAAVELPTHVPLRPRNVHWLQPRLVVEVAFRGWAKEGLLRQASFRGLREDKDMDELAPAREPVPARAKPGTRANTAKGAAPAKAGRVRANATRAAAAAGAADVVITHPERVVYPADGLTKGDVAAYYRAIAPWLLRDIAGRPLSLVRCPDGAAGQCFFQKHHGAGFGEAVHALPLRQKSGVEDYVWIDDATGLLQLVQMNVLEFHPWGATVADPEQADRLVFDLDPGEGVPWKAVCDGAREVRARLREAGLESFLRMSGGKGLHVVVPLAPAVPWERARDFCEAFARAMEAHAPERWLANARKAQRTGRIFLDWLRNTRGATSVASWSLRAREHATVAVPLRWEELGKLDRPGAFTPDKALQRASRLRKDPGTGSTGCASRCPRGESRTECRKSPPDRRPLPAAPRRPSMAPCARCSAPCCSPCPWPGC